MDYRIEPMTWENRPEENCFVMRVESLCLMVSYPNLKTHVTYWFLYRQGSPVASGPAKTFEAAKAKVRKEAQAYLRNVIKNLGERN